RGERLGLRLGDRSLVEDDDAAVLGLRREGVTQRERAHLLRQVVGVAAHHRAEHAGAAAEVRRAGRTVTGAAGALLRVHLLAGPHDVVAVLGLVRAGLALGELPIDAALDQVGARLEPEDVLRQAERAGFLTLEGGDFHIHLTRPPAGPALPPSPRTWRPPRGTCPASAHPSAAPSSPRRGR